MQRNIPLSLPIDDLREIDRVSRRVNLNRSAVMRQAIRVGLPAVERAMEPLNRKIEQAGGRKAVAARCRRLAKGGGA